MSPLYMVDLIVTKLSHDDPQDVQVSSLVGDSVIYNASRIWPYLFVAFSLAIGDSAPLFLANLEMLYGYSYWRSF